MICISCLIIIVKHFVFLDTKKYFAIVVWSANGLKEVLYAFVLVEDNVDKSTFLETLCRQIANSVCKADVVSTFFLCVNLQC